MEKPGNRVQNGNRGVSEEHLDGMNYSQTGLEDSPNQLQPGSMISVAACSPLPADTHHTTTLKNSCLS